MAFQPTPVPTSLRNLTCRSHDELNRGVRCSRRGIAYGEIAAVSATVDVFLA
jgi:hypothetical protein